MICATQFLNHESQVVHTTKIFIIPSKTKKKTKSKKFSIFISPLVSTQPNNDNSYLKLKIELIKETYLRFRFSAQSRGFCLGKGIIGRKILEQKPVQIRVREAVFFFLNFRFNY